MNGFRDGANSAVQEIVGGLITSIIVAAIAASGLLPSSYYTMFKLVNLLGTITLILTMPIYGFTYLLGWIVALWILFNAGLASFIDIVFFVGIPVCIIILRIANAFDDYL